VGAFDGLAPLGLDNHVREGETGQVFSHVIANIGPHTKQNTLSLVVTGAIAMRFAEISGHNGSVNRGHNLGERDGIGTAS
jgi:hypothetical protein